MAGIQLDDVTKRYADGFEAVKHMDLEIADGEFMILVGPSGCGKSTALRMIAGLEDITDGELLIDDQVVNDKAPKDRDIAMVFQNYALYPHMTVRENMGFALKLAKVDKAEIDQQVERGRRDPRPRASTSTASRPTSPAASASASRWGARSCATPSAFLMDEPLSNLDAKLRVQMRTEVSRIQQRLGTTTVYVTHDQTEAMTLGDRVAVMRAGVLQQVDTPEGALRAPGQPLRRRLHRVAGDELLPRRGRRATRCACRSARSRCPSALRGAAGKATRHRGRAPRGLRGRRARGRAPPRHRPRVRGGRSTSPSRWARRSTPTSASRAARRSPTSWPRSRPTPAWPTCRARSDEAAQVVARLNARERGQGGLEGPARAGHHKLHLFDPSDGTNIAHRGG